MRPPDEISAAIERVTGQAVAKNGSARCPAHDDQTASLSVSEGTDGRVLLHCFAGCSFEDIMAALSLDVTAAFPETTKAAKNEIVATYDYVDESGSLLYESVRFEPKRFLQRKPDEKDGWVWNLNGTQRVLYRLPNVQEAARNGGVVLVVEGEKDVESLEGIGLTATTNPGGALKWRDEYSEYLTGAHVVVVPDNDDVGRQHVNKVARSVYGKAASVRILEFPGLAEHGDASDWIAAGGTREQLIDLANEAPDFVLTVTNGQHEESEFADIPKDTDLGNAKRFCADHVGDLRYATFIKKWIHWTGQQWEFDEKGEAHARAHDTVENMLREAIDITDNDKRKKAIKWAIASQSANRLNAMVNRAQSIRTIPIDPDALDRNPDLLNVQNGTVDLATGELLEHDRDGFITKICPVRYDSEATCSRWIRFLEEIFEQKTDLVRFVQTAFGYSMTGNTSERCLFILHGAGANGKSVLLETIMYLLGAYAQAARSELLLSQKIGGASEGEAALKGARFVITSESGAKQSFNEAVIKRLTGRDTIRARFLYSNEFEFEATHKIWFATNHKPAVDDTDDAIWDRIRLVPFRATFKGEAAEKDLPDQLRSEAPGILNWLIEGCLRWRAEGLTDSVEVKKATRSTATIWTCWQASSATAA
ncbi:MAG: hypothetical protein BMS9Abin05_2277 [Rhodothermia bacterium]|nr:MAG: hypothetical protein BMS9Abin05_2277 [Rhodothermia bacterium]